MVLPHQTPTDSGILPFRPQGPQQPVKPDQRIRLHDGIVVHEQHMGQVVCFFLPQDLQHPPGKASGSPGILIGEDLDTAMGGRHGLLDIRMRIQGLPVIHHIDPDMSRDLQLLAV